MSDDLEKFLQRAAQRRRQRTEPSIVIVGEPLRPEIVEPEIVEPILILGEESVGEHVRSHLSNSAFSQRAEQMGDKVDTVNEKMDQRIHDVFDHKLGNLTVSVDDPNSISDDVHTTPDVVNWVADMLRNPSTLRQVIVLNEIMTPAFRRR
jgi:hypothetical protein